MPYFANLLNNNNREKWFSQTGKEVEEHSLFDQFVKKAYYISLLERRGMKIEFVSPEEAAQKILARFTEKGLNWSSSLRQISRELGIGFGVKSLMRWVTEPSRYQQKLQLLWWAVSNPDQIPDLKQTRELLAQSDPTTLERLLAESYPVQRQRIVRWKTALPSGGVWEVQAVLALARVLLKEDADAQSRSHCPGCRCVRSLGGGAESRATRLASPSSAEAREATAS